MFKSVPRAQCRWPVFLAMLVALLSWAVPSTLAAQGTAAVRGTLTRADNGAPLAGVTVTIRGTRISTVTNSNGQYEFARVPVGPQVILVRWIGYQPAEVAVTVTAGGSATADAALVAQAISLGEVVVTGVSRAPERVVEAPAAVSVVSAATLRDISVTSQVPLALAHLPGTDVVQSGVNDFNVNARGFNSSLNRRVLVLQDGRDLAIAFLGSQEWNSLSMPLEDIGTMEMVRGPGSALYGANAFSGVINITTPTAREVIGTKISVGGGELSTFKTDIRHAGVTPDGKFGYKFNAGFYTSGTWTRSRTGATDLASEYAGVTDEVITAPTPGFELRPLDGQTGAPGTSATGDRDDLRNIFGSGRFDYYGNNSLFSIEGGATQVENEVFVTGIGRVQVTKALRPWARVSWGNPNYNLMAWYSGRKSLDPQFSLASGVPLEESSRILHIEGQYNRSFAEDRARIVLGGSARSYHVDTENTLMSLADDNRTDGYFSGYGQFEYKLTPQWRIVAASRVDKGDLFNTQFSPKGAIVFSPNEDHAIRFTVNRAFQVPNYSEFFLRVNIPGNGTTSPGDLEAGLEGYYATVQNPLVVGPGLAAVMGGLGLPADIPWNFDAATGAFALGNPTTNVEHVTSFELGYKGTIADRAYVSVDFFLSKITDFVTDLLPAVLLPGGNPKYSGYSLSDGGTDVLGDLTNIDAVLAGAGLPAAHPLRAIIDTLLRPGFQQLAAGAGPLLATLPGGNRALVISYANAGEVTEKGVEVGIGVAASPEFRIDGTYTFFDFDIDQISPDDIVPNTPKHKGSIALSYNGLQGFDASVKARLVDSFDWAAGVFEGRIPSSQTFDVTAGYQLNPNLRLSVLVTNLFDQDRFHLFGGSLVGRRMLGGATATF